MWQDFVFSIVGIVFTLILVPQLLDVFNKRCNLNCLTCATTGVGCFIIAFVDTTLNLPFAALISVITGIIWLLLLIFSIKNSKTTLIQQKSLNRDMTNNNIERG